MNLHNRNRLINQYRNYQQNNNIYNNNSLLHNPMFQNNTAFNSPLNSPLNSPQQQQMIANRMREQQNIQNIRRMEELNKILVNMNKDELREMIIKPEKIKKNISKKIQKNYDIAKKSFPVTRKAYWNKRTNIPYKGIITEEKHIKKFINRKGKINEKELIVYKTTKADRLKAYEQYDKLKDSLEKHNNELKVIYSLSKATKHKESFDYNHKYKFRIKYNPSSDHKQLRDNKIEHYKREQQKLEKNKIKFENIVNALVDDGTFTAEDLQKFNNINIAKSNSSVTINNSSILQSKKTNNKYKSSACTVFVNKSNTKTYTIARNKNIRPIRNTRLRSIGNKNILDKQKKSIIIIKSNTRV